MERVEVEGDGHRVAERCPPRPPGGGFPPYHELFAAVSSNKAGCRLEARGGEGGYAEVSTATPRNRRRCAEGRMATHRVGNVAGAEDLANVVLLRLPLCAECAVVVLLIVVDGLEGEESGA